MTCEEFIRRGAETDLPEASDKVKEEMAKHVEKCDSCRKRVMDEVAKRNIKPRS